MAQLAGFARRDASTHAIGALLPILTSLEAPWNHSSELTLLAGRSDAGSGRTPTTSRRFSGRAMVPEDKATDVAEAVRGWRDELTVSKDRVLYL